MSDHSSWSGDDINSTRHDQHPLEHSLQDRSQTLRLRTCHAVMGRRRIFPPTGVALVSAINLGEMMKLTVPSAHVRKKVIKNRHLITAGHLASSLLDDRNLSLMSSTTWSAAACSNASVYRWKTAGNKPVCFFHCTFYLVHSEAHCFSFNKFEISRIL